MIELIKRNCSMVILLMMFAQTIFAQERTPESDETQQAKQQVAETQQNDNPETSNRDAEDQVFIPSEEISEDAPVAFPVDI